VLTACTSSANGTAEPTATTSVSTSVTTPSELPAQLPTLTEGHVKDSVDSLLLLAAKHAVGAPQEDRDPELTEVSDSPCAGSQGDIQIATCPPEIATQPVNIEINLALTWSAFQKQQSAGSVSNTTALQNNVLGAYADYLAYRSVERDHPDLLVSPTDAITDIRMCKAGEVYAGLRSALSAELTQLWQQYQTGVLNEYFKKGMRGEC